MHGQGPKQVGKNFFPQKSVRSIIYLFEFIIVSGPCPRNSASTSRRRLRRGEEEAPGRQRGEAPRGGQTRRPNPKVGKKNFIGLCFLIWGSVVASWPISDQSDEGKKKEDGQFLMLFFPLFFPRDLSSIPLEIVPVGDCLQIFNVPIF